MEFDSCAYDARALHVRLKIIKRDTPFTPPSLVRFYAAVPGRGTEEVYIDSTVSEDPCGIFLLRFFLDNAISFGIVDLTARIHDVNHLSSQLDGESSVYNVLVPPYSLRQPR